MTIPASFSRPAAKTFGQGALAKLLLLAAGTIRDLKMPSPGTSKAELPRQDDHMLRDIGMTRQNAGTGNDARWDIPDYWRGGGKRADMKAALFRTGAC